MRRTIATALALFAAVATVGASFAPAGAKLLDHQAGRINETIPDDELCGIPVTTRIVGASSLQVRVNGAGLPVFLDTGHLTYTFTAEDGRWVTFSFSGPAKDLSVTPLGGDIIVVRHMLSGIGAALTASNGDSIRSIGNTVTDFTIDTAGTPLDLDDDELLDVQVVRVSGAHNVDIDFCAFASDHLT